LPILPEEHRVAEFHLGARLPPHNHPDARIIQTENLLGVGRRALADDPLVGLLLRAGQAFQHSVQPAQNLFGLRPRPFRLRPLLGQQFPMPPRVGPHDAHQLLPLADPALREGEPQTV
jgi:hypothetical protein